MNRELKSVEIKDIGAIDEFRCDVGAVTIISGRNGSGKTSVLNAISTVFEGGHDPALIRLGAKSGEVILTLNDGAIIRKLITPTGSTLTVRTKDGGVVKGPKRYVESLAKGFAFDPLAFDEAPQKERMKFLLEALPVEFTPDELRRILPVAPNEPVGLNRLNEIRAGIYSDRADANRKVRDIEGSITTLEKSLPEGDGAEWKARAAALVEEISQKRETLAAAKADLDEQRARMKAEKRSEADKQIQTLRKALADEEKRIDADTTAAEKRIDEEAAKIYEEGVTEIRTEMERLSSEHGTAKQKAEEWQRAEGIRLSIQRYQEELAGINLRALTRAIEGIDRLKAEKLSTLPIDGLDIKDGEIYVSGVPWEHVNTSERYVIAIQLATLRAGELGLMVCDKAEHLDAERFEEFKAAIAQSGLTVIAARVDDGDLRVERISDSLGVSEDDMPANKEVL